MYNEGLIYKGERMINWCPTCKTSISDAEVEFEEELGNLWHIKYQIKDSDKYIVIATTRPETMLGDIAVAVHPEDERYKDIIGKTLILPIVNREIKVIADEFVEKEFGTGCVKITPAHDFNDYEAGKKHDLEFIQVFDENGIMKDIVPKYQGMDILTARKAIVEDLEKLNVIEKVEDYTHNVGKCYRCHKTIEPMISDQWFVKMEELAKPAIDVVRNGKVKFVPGKFDKTYFNWMENIKDWCISRQLWWGHRIPAYYCKECGETIVSKDNITKCTKCGSLNVEQDPDTLDTWFSSALWPFSTMGWPNKTPELEYFYPTNTLVTAYDIIFFWVARMIFSSLKHMNEIPFDTVFMHGLVRDAQGRKMSKSLGNGIDPLDIIDEYGTDALRFSLVQNMTLGNDIKYSTDKAFATKNFANKIWNASKFVISNINEELKDYDENKLQIEDKWIINKLNKLVLSVSNNIDNYDVGIAANKIYDFIWNEFCDWYIEIVKPRLYDENCDSKKEAMYTLNYILVNSLKLLHPFMPFLTEKIYMNLFVNNESIMLDTWPKLKEEFEFDEEEKQIELLKNIIVKIRNIRANMNVVPSKKTKLIFVTTKYEKLIEDSKDFLLKLGFAKEIEIRDNKENIPNNAISIMEDNIELFIPFEDLVDIDAEKNRLEEEKKRLIAEVTRCEKILSNPGFVAKAPEAKIAEEKQKLEKYKEMLKTTEERLNNL